MTALKLYILRLLVGSVLSSILLSMVHEKQYEALLRNVCGIFLTILLLGPMGEISWDFEFKALKDTVSDGKKYILRGTSMARQAREQFISEALETYILDKAGRDNISLTVDVTLGEDLVPEEIQIQGQLDQHIEQELTEIIEKELGISKENQIWIG